MPECPIQSVKYQNTDPHQSNDGLVSRAEIKRLLGDAIEPGDEWYIHGTTESAVQTFKIAQRRLFTATDPQVARRFAQRTAEKCGGECHLCGARLIYSSSRGYSRLGTHGGASCSNICLRLHGVIWSGATSMERTATQHDLRFAGAIGLRCCNSCAPRHRAK